MEAQVLIPQNSLYRRIINFLKNINSVNIFVKKINACRKIEIKCIERESNFQKTDVVLDIGSGDGYWTNYFGKRCGKITGVEPYEEHIQIAQKNNYKNCNIKCWSERF